jgi:hypothetical protein
MVFFTLFCSKKTLKIGLDRYDVTIHDIWPFYFDYVCLSYLDMFMNDILICEYILITISKITPTKQLHNRKKVVGGRNVNVGVEK